MMSYHMLEWTIEDKTGVTDFILQINNSKNIIICADRNTYLFQKDKNDADTISIVSMDKCNRINGMSDYVSLPPNVTCK